MSDAGKKVETQMPEEAPVKRSKRDPHIDVMKGIGMCLVIMTHMDSVPLLGYSMVAYAMTFMLPMFLFVTGYLHNSSSDAKIGFGAYLMKKIRTLFIPYAVFFAFSYLWTNTVQAWATGGQLFSFEANTQELTNAFIFAGKYLFKLAIIPFPIWFLHASFFVSIPFYFIMKIKSRWGLITIALLLALITVPLKDALINNPVWLFRLMPPALFYMICGRLFRGWISEKVQDRIQTGGILYTMILPALLMGSGLFIMRFARGDLWEVGSYLFFPGSLLSIMGCYLFAQNTDNRALQYIGVNSMLYLGLQSLILGLPFIWAMPDWLRGYGFDGIILFVGYFIVSTLLITLMVQLTLWVENAFKEAFE